MEPPQTPQQMLEVHEVALDTLRLRAVPVPSLAEILSTDWQPERDTVQSLKEKIEKEKKDQRTFLTKLYDLNAMAYLEDVEHRYFSRNDLLDIDPKVWKEGIEREKADGDAHAIKIDLDGLTEHELQLMAEANEKQRKFFDESYPYPFSPTARSPDVLPTINRHNYAYLKRLENLYKRLRLAEVKQAKEDEEQRKRNEQELYNQKRREEERVLQGERDRRERETVFPATPAELKAKGRDMRDRVVRFLGVSSNQGVDFGRKLVPLQEKMLRDFGWSQESVLPLLKIYAKDDKFRVEIQVEYSMQQKQTPDPRQPR
ncbi:hypothetical protein K435DRAFT_778343 [Dendrothele bispora CBS 962.96]|uniref:Uncharacterized protein n=1 Tax=Dendrothele bispora (strain CBS 962.96) TaxID=1314807 RepID=A0A4S8M575_DENBC|nr:hypothetical protein K435DRAFT_778343 [Dendrothele bispora CBS 962.96]